MADLIGHVEGQASADDPKLSRLFFLIYNNCGGENLSVAQK
jgi:hypothetical protein